MAKLSVLKGATSVLCRIFIQDSSSTTGAGLTGLVFNSSGLVCYRARDDDGNAGGTAITLATATLGTWTSAGFKEKDATNMPGWYEFGIPNAALATGSRSVSIHFKGATNMAPLALEIELTGVDNQDGVRYGMTALPNAAAEAAGGLYTRGSGAGQINQDANGRIDINVKALLGTAWLTPGTAGTPDVNAKLIGGQTASAAGTVTFPGTIASTNNITTVASVAALASGSIVRSSFAADTGLQSIRSNTAQAGGASTITLDAGSSGVTDFYKGALIYITGGVGAGQARFCTAYNGGTKVATVGTAWVTNPDNTSTFAVLPNDAITAVGFPTNFALLSIDANGRVDVIKVNGTGQTARDLGADTSAIKTQTDKLTFTVSNVIDANALRINGDATAAANLAKSALSIYLGAVTGATSTTTLIDSGLTQSDTDFWKGRIVIFITGSLKYQATDITGFDPATDKLTFTALTIAPSGGDTYVVI